MRVLWSDRQNCSHNVSQKLKRIRRLSVPSYVPSVPRTFCPLNLSFHINRAKHPGCPWDIPNLSLGRTRGTPTTKLLHIIFLCRFFSIFVVPFWLLTIGPKFRNAPGFSLQRPQPSSSVLLTDICVMFWGGVGLAAQCEIRPHITQYLFEMVSERS